MYPKEIMVMATTGVVYLGEEELMICVLGLDAIDQEITTKFGSKNIQELRSKLKKAKAEFKKD